MARCCPSSSAASQTARESHLCSHPRMPPVTTLWTTLAVQDFEEARQLLADREARPKKGSTKIVGCWSPSAAAGTYTEEIGSWAQAHGLDAAAGPPSVQDSTASTVASRRWTRS